MNMMYNKIDSVTAVCDELAFVATDVLALGAMAGTYMHSKDEMAPDIADKAVAEFVTRTSEYLHDKITALENALSEFDRDDKTLPTDPDEEVSETIE